MKTVMFLVVVMAAYLVCSTDAKTQESEFYSTYMYICRYCTCTCTCTCLVLRFYMLCDLSQSVEKDSCTRVAVDVKERVSSRLFRAREAVTVAASVRSSVKCCMMGNASHQWIVRNFMHYTIYTHMSWR